MRRAFKGSSPWLSRLVLVCAASLGVYVVALTVQKAEESHRLGEQAEALRQEVARLKQENLQLQQELVYHRSDAYVEKAAREQLNLAKPGDVVLIAAMPTPEATPAPLPESGSAASAKEQPFWRRWLHVLAGL